MQPIQINVSVNIGVTDGLSNLLSSLIGKPQAEAETAAAPAPRKPRAAKAQPVVENKPKPEPAPAAEPEQPEAAPTAEPQPETAAPAETPEPAKEYTEVDVRAAIDRTRRRIEGENWKENPDSEGYKMWHRALTGWFKNTATMCGAERPSALPDSESREKFIKCCDAVYVKDNELTYDCPF